jgi:ATP-dependent DNA helicase RecQ
MEINPGSLDKYRQILVKYWGYSSFRPMQEEVIHSVAEGKDTLALMPTGGGKSITFQVPALLKEGICVVVTPLIALMKDQVENLHQRGIKAYAIHSGMTRDEINLALENCVYGDYKFIYVSPERLGTDLFRARVQKMNVNLLAIDEAHCISQWGYDFRPSYLRISELRQYLPDTPVLALTATATPEVAKDIMDKLSFREPNLLQKSFARENLVYVVRETEDKVGSLLKIVQTIPGTAVVYTRNRRKTKEVAQFLIEQGISADYYHAGLKDTERNKKQDAWKKGKCRIIVSTNAFGMGIDKADVRLVVHMDVPDSLEAYFQEAGRAGRDEKKAWAVLLYHPSDIEKLDKRLEQNFPPIPVIKKVYQAVGNFFQVAVGSGKELVFDFNISDFIKAYHLELLVSFSSLKALETEGYITLTDELDNPSRVHFIVARDDLYKFQVANAQFDGFIKLLLRSYTGLFSDYVRIDEQMLAERAGISGQQVYDYLVKLSKYKIINYIPRKKTPLLVYNEERLDDKNLFISPDKYRARKDMYKTRLDAITHYIKHPLKCRSQLLLAYFGETDSYRCGHCDNCLKRNELDISKYEFDLILDNLKKVLEKESMSIVQLIRESKQNEEKTIKVIQWLLDHEKIIQGEDQELRWNKKQEFGKL